MIPIIEISHCNQNSIINTSPGKKKASVPSFDTASPRRVGHGRPRFARRVYTYRARERETRLHPAYPSPPLARLASRAPARLLPSLHVQQRHHGSARARGSRIVAPSTLTFAIVTPGNFSGAAMSCDQLFPIDAAARKLITELPAAAAREFRA